MRKILQQFVRFLLLGAGLGAAVSTGWQIRSGLRTKGNYERSQLRWEMYQRCLKARAAQNPVLTDELKIACTDKVYEVMPLPLDDPFRGVLAEVPSPDPLPPIDWLRVSVLVGLGFLVGGGIGLAAWILWRAVYFAVNG